MPQVLGPFSVQPGIGEWKIAKVPVAIGGNQDVIGTFVFGGVFDRVPELYIVCTEADAGWVPHWMYRADHAVERHRNWLADRVLALQKVWVDCGYSGTGQECARTPALLMLYGTRPCMKGSTA